MSRIVCLLGSRRQSNSITTSAADGHFNELVPGLDVPAFTGSKHREPRTRQAKDVALGEGLARRAGPHIRSLARGRGFAIVPRADAGKTTLTEKLLLFGRAIQLAGEVKARGEQWWVRSDWMAV